MKTKTRAHARKLQRACLALDDGQLTRLIKILDSYHDENDDEFYCDFCSHYGATWDSDDDGMPYLCWGLSEKLTLGWIIRDEHGQICKNFQALVHPLVEEDDGVVIQEVYPFTIEAPTAWSTRGCWQDLDASQFYHAARTVFASVFPSIRGKEPPSLINDGYPWFSTLADTLAELVK